MAYIDMEETTREFFRCSIARDFSEFPWDDVFDTAQERIKYYLDMHGLTDEDSFREWYVDLYGRNDIEKRLDIFTVQTDYIYISADDIFDGIIHCLFEKYRDAFEDVGEFVILKELYEKLDHIPQTDSERAILFDEVIHAQHVNGDIFDDFNVEDIKKEVDAEYAEKATVI